MSAMPYVLDETAAHVEEATADIASTTRALEAVQAALEVLEVAELDRCGEYAGMACSNLRQARSRLWAAHQAAIANLRAAQEGEQAP